ncbi:MAG: hypothetical protein ACYTDV_21455 [Planctomycetota bacterium]
MPRVIFVFSRRLPHGTLYFCGGNGDTVAFLEDVVPWHGLAVDSNEAVGRFLARHFLVEKPFHCRPFRYGDVICEP